MTERIERLIANLRVEIAGEAIGPEVLAQLNRFDALVAQWNRRLNLTGPGSPDKRAEILFTDALVLASVLPEGAHFVDVGAGAGAPSLPVAILRPDVRAMLVEPRRKRVAFMRTAVGTLGLVERVEVREGRLEEIDVGEPDVAISRATFAPSDWLEHGREIAPSVVVFCGAEELPDPGLGRITARREYSLPFSGSPRALGVYSRV